MQLMIYVMICVTTLLNIYYAVVAELPWKIFSYAGVILGIIGIILGFKLL